MAVRQERILETYQQLHLVDVTKLIDDMSWTIEMLRDKNTEVLMACLANNSVSRMLAIVNNPTANNCFERKIIDGVIQQMGVTPEELRLLMEFKKAVEATERLRRQAELIQERVNELNQAATEAMGNAIASLVQF